MSVFHYRVFGLNIQCPFECPLLQPTDSAPEVIIEFGYIPDKKQLRSNDFLLEIKGIATYLVQNGNRIIIEARESAQLNEIQLFLFGSAMGGLLHQRSLLVLHGCAIEFLEGVVVFVAHSGTGKSTLASCFYQDGFNIFCDDQSVIDVNQDFSVQQGLGQIKLWRNVLEERGLKEQDFQKVYKNDEKYIVPVKQRALKPRPLLAVVELQITQAYSFEGLRGKSKMEVLINHTYRNQYLAEMKLLSQHFSLYDKVSHAIPIFRATRPKETESSRDFFKFILQQLKLQEIHAASYSIKADECVGVLE